MLAGIFLHCFRGATVGVPLAENGIHGTSLDLIVIGTNRLFALGLRVIRIIRELVSLGLQLSDRGLQLRNGGADVRKLDDIRLGLKCQCTQLCQGISDSLILCEKIGESGDDAPGQGDVAEFDSDPGMLCERLHDRQERIGGQGGSLVGLGIENGWQFGHDVWEIKGRRKARK